jgi:hypothetical protein
VNADLHVELVKEINEPQKVTNWNDFLEGAETFMSGLENQFEKEGLYFSAEVRLYSGMEEADLIMASTLYDIDVGRAKDIVLALEDWAKQNGFTLGEVSLEFGQDQDVASKLNVPRLMSENGIRMEIEKGKVAVAFTPNSLKNFDSLFEAVVQDLQD